MKKSNLIISSFVLGVTLFSLATPAFANESEGSVELTGKVEGSLSIEEVPSFEFGSQEISSEKQVFRANGNNPLTISDFRGTGAGWSVTAKITEFFDGSHTLIGEELTLPATEPETKGSEGAKPESGKETILNHEDQLILNAKKDTGLGQWSEKFEEVKLAVPSGNYSGAYTALIEWTLVDQPAAEKPSSES